jgi:hypothetical protein
MSASLGEVFPAFIIAVQTAMLLRYPFLSEEEREENEALRQELLKEEFTTEEKDG